MKHIKFVVTALALGFLAGGLLFLFSCPSQAVDADVWLSSHTATADTTKNLCVATNYLVGTSTLTTGGRGVFHGACVNSGVAASSLTVYNSSGTATAAVPIAVIQTSTAMPCSLYDVGVSSGLTYTTSGTADVTILYQCY